MGTGFARGGRKKGPPLRRRGEPAPDWPKRVVWGRSSVAERRRKAPALMAPARRGFESRRPPRGGNEDTMRIGPFSVAIETITPQQAQAYLDGRDLLNRSISYLSVQKYAQQMRMGSWKLSHQGIAFDEGGRLIDGQHRMSAVVSYGQPVEFIVFRDAPAETKGLVDSGKTRQPADRGVIAGILDQDTARQVAPIISAITQVFWVGGKTSLDVAIMERIVALSGDDIAWSLEALKGREYSATLRAIFALARPLNRERMNELAEHVTTAVGLESYTGAWHIVQFMKSGRMNNSGNTRDRRASLCRAARAVELWLDRRHAQEIKVTDGHLERLLKARELKGLWSTWEEIAG